MNSRILRVLRLFLDASFCQSKTSAGKPGGCAGSAPALGSPDADDTDVLKPHLKTIVSNHSCKPLGSLPACLVALTNPRLPQHLLGVVFPPCNAAPCIWVKVHNYILKRLKMYRQLNLEARKKSWMKTRLSTNGKETGPLTENALFLSAWGTATSLSRIQPNSFIP